jgi:choline dehydrogenase
MRLEDSQAEFDYIVVGSGAGGGPLASRLAMAGMRVLLLEAGGDTTTDTYRVPCFHGLATEDPEYTWEFFVRHYNDEERQRRDTKFCEEQDGIFYPRAGTLGGCTAHNAMITIYPHAADWDRIAEVTGDQSWASHRMRRYFELLERCRYGRRPWAYPRNPLLTAILRRIPILNLLFGNRGRHGYDGWLTTSLADPTLVVRDGQLLNVVLRAARATLAQSLGRPLQLAEDLLLGSPLAYLDPNDWRVGRTSGIGLWLVPLATRKGNRNGSRELIEQVRNRFPRNLVVRTGCLVTRVLLDRDNRAVGIEYLEGRHAYRADPASATAPANLPTRRDFVTREVILSGGAFNTPQLLMLSGIGPKEELERFGIPVRVNLPGVGANLQDRYEVGVVSEMERPFSLLTDCTFEPPLVGQQPDPCFRQWLEGKGVYASNGAVLGVIKKSREDRPLADLFIFGLPARFEGYQPGYSRRLEQSKSMFTWAVLKAHTTNTAGSVRLRSADPRDTPDINFRYFDEGNDARGQDIESMVEGVLFARQLMENAAPYVIREVTPGRTVKSREEIADFVKREAWGHHASCTCKIGADDDPQAVLDSHFRVRGTRGLRVVDASVFPRIPGFFIVTSVYMISEKAADDILTDVPMRERTTRVVGTWMQARLGRLRSVLVNERRSISRFFRDS